MSRTLSSLDIYVIVSELQELLGSYVDKIYQPTHNEVLIKVNNKKTAKKEAIYASCSEFLCLTSKKIDVPQKPPSFAMALRKYISNGIITKIWQHEFDRIIKINVSKKDGEYTLIFEIFKNGNIILLRPDGTILIPLITQKWSHRIIKGKQKYESPPSQLNTFDLSFEGFSNIIKNSDKDLVRTLAVDINLSGKYAEEVCFRADFSKNIKTSDLSPNQISEIFESLRSFLAKFQNKNFRPNYVSKEGKIIEICPVIFKSYPDYEIKKLDSFCRGYEKFIEKREVKTKRQSKQDEKLGKLKRMIDQQKKTIEKFEKKIVDKKKQGDVLYLNYQKIEEILNKITDALKLKDKTEVIKEINKNDFVKIFDPTYDKFILILKDEKGKNIEINLDFRKSVSENAEDAYESSKKFQDKIQGAKDALKKTEENLDKLKEKEVLKQEKNKEKSNQKNFWFERFRWFISSEGNIVVAGKDAKSNEIVVKKYLNDGDRYCHADVHGAPSCVIKNKNIENDTIKISEKTLEEACIFAASYSKAWNQFAEAQSYWVLPEQVSRTPESGEYLPKGAFIIRGKRNHFRCKLEIAIGEIKIKDVKKIMAGPIKAVNSKSEKYVIINPGQEKKNVVANKLSKIFNVQIEDIQKILPPGDINIVKSEGIKI